MILTKTDEGNLKFRDVKGATDEEIKAFIFNTLIEISQRPEDFNFIATRDAIFNSVRYNIIDW
jgi:hypothetical protein